MDANWKKILFYTIFNLVIGIILYWIISMRSMSILSKNENFTSTSSGLIWDSSNIWIAGKKQGVVYKATPQCTNLSESETSAQSSQSSQPFQLLSIGLYVWVTNYATGTLVSINQNDGSISSETKVGYLPTGMAFDGANIWVCNTGNNTCSVVSQGSSDVIATIPVGQNPTCALFDGQNVWVCCSVSSDVYLFDPSQLSLTTKFSVGSSPTRMTFIDKYLYVIEYGQNSKIYKMNTNGIQNTFMIDGLTGCTDITNDSKLLYVTTLNGNVFVFDSDGNQKPENEFDTGLDARYIQIINSSIYIIGSEKLNNYTKTGDLIITTNFYPTD